MNPRKVRDNWKCLKQQGKNQTSFMLVVNETIEVRTYLIKEIIKWLDNVYRVLRKTRRQ